MLGPLDCHRYIGVVVISKIVISRFFPIYFTITFTGTKNFHLYTWNIVISRIVVSGFHCSR